MNDLTVLIIDYGAGNLRSVANAIARVGYPVRITSNASDLLDAKAVILPGVGSGGDTMQSLNNLGLADPIRRYTSEGRAFMGICIGLQVLFTRTEEGGKHDCLDIIPGVVKKLPPGQKIPHMGWNQVKQKMTHPVFENVPDGANFYFVHSYYAKPDDESVVVGETSYGLKFCSVLAKE